MAPKSGDVVLYVPGPNDWQVARVQGTNEKTGELVLAVFPNPIQGGALFVVCEWWDGSGARPTQNYAFDVPGR